VNTVAGVAPNVTTVAGISANVTTVAGVAANVTTVAGISANVTTVAGISANVTAVAGVASDIPIVAANVADISNFADVYQGAKSTPPTLRNDGGALQIGDLYFNSVSNAMFVYASTGWVPAGSSVNGTSRRFRYIATAGQTTFTGSDSNGNTMAYDAGFVDVYLNGVRLDQTDYTASSGTSIVLGSAAALNDELNIVAFGTFSVASINGVDIINATVSANKLASGAAVSNIGYTPVNKAGDTMTGSLEVQASWRLGTNTGGSGGGAPYAGGLGGGFNPNNNVYSMYCRDRTDTHFNDLWIETKTLSLKTNGGNTAIYADQSGRVTTPYQPAFSAKNSTSLTINNSGTDFIVPYSDTITNRGNHYNNSTYRFTAPVSGFYFFAADIQITGTINDFGYFFIRFHVNGSDISQEKMMPRPSGGSYATQYITMGIYLNANDYVQAVVRQSGGTTVTIRTDQRNFSGFLTG
jgi:hypothetical protein